MKVLNLREISKTAPWNSSKSWVKFLRTTVTEWGWTRRHENGAFGTEIFRRIRQEGSRSPKIPQHGNAENQFFIFWLLKNNKIHHTLIIIKYAPHKNLHLGFRQKLGSKFCVPPLWQGGGRNATKSGRSVVKFSGEGGWAWKERSRSPKIPPKRKNWKFNFSKNNLTKSS